MPARTAVCAAMKSFHAVVWLPWFSQTPDFIDKLGVVAQRSIAVWAHIHRPDRVSIGVVSKPRCASAGDSCFAPSDRSPATFRKASETDASRSAPVGLARHCVV